MSTIEPRTEVVTIYTGDYLSRIRHLERQAQAAKEASDGLPRLASDIPDYVRIAEEHDALVAEAKKSAVDVKIQPLPRRVWRALVAAHPPRENHRPDSLVGFNEDTLSDALVYGGEVEVDGQSVAFRSIVEPDLTAEDIDGLADVDFERLYYTAFGCNRGQVSDPKASLVSRLTQTSDETSN